MPIKLVIRNTTPKMLSTMAKVPFIVPLKARMRIITATATLRILSMVPIFLIMMTP